MINPTRELDGLDLAISGVGMGGIGGIGGIAEPVGGAG
jgi:hypothetical protein